MTASILERTLEGLPPILVYVAFGELVLNRVLSRATIFIPKGPIAEVILSAFAFVGFFLLAFAVLLTLVWLFAFAAQSVDTKRTEWRERLLALLLLFFLVLGTVAVLGGSPLVTLVFAATFVVILTLLLADLLRGPLFWKAFVLAVGGAYILHTLAIGVSSAASLWPTMMSGGSIDGLQRGGEVMVLAVAPLLFVAVARAQPGRWSMSLRTAIVAAVPAAVFAFLASLNLAILASISLWSLGFSLFLPYPLYAAGLWLFGVATLSVRGRGERMRWIGLLLLFAAGYNLNLSYLFFLAVLALILLIPAGGSLSFEAPWDTHPRAPPQDEAP